MKRMILKMKGKVVISAFQIGKKGLLRFSISKIQLRSQFIRFTFKNTYPGYFPF